MQAAASPVQAEEPKKGSTIAGAENPSVANPSLERSPKPSVIELERTPGTMQADRTSRSDDADRSAHRETEVAVASGVAVSGAIVNPSPVETPASQPAPANPANDLPPLPAEGADPAARNHILLGETPKESGPAPSPSTADELPPLPIELGHPAAGDASSSSPPITVSTPVPAAPATAVLPEPLPNAGPASTALAEHANGSTETDSSPVNLPPLPEERGAVQPDQRESAARPNSADRESPVSAVPHVASGDGASDPGPGGAAPTVDSSDPLLRRRAYPPSTLRPELQREVDRIARLQEEELQRRAANPPQPVPPPDTTSSDLRMQTQQDISRAPSPAEARPIKAIPVPEDWVPLGPRDWTPQRKYWAAAATCHLPLYFQDAVLERYGHSVEQFVGPLWSILDLPGRRPNAVNPAQSDSPAVLLGGFIRTANHRLAL